MKSIRNPSTVLAKIIYTFRIKVSPSLPTYGWTNPDKVFIYFYSMASPISL